MTASLKQIAGAALSSLETLEATYDIARSAIERRIPGDFAEAGVFAGAQAAAMALAIMDHCRDRHSFAHHVFGTYYAPRRVHLFDSFEGIPQAGEHDAEFLEAGHKAGLSACSLQYVVDSMAAWGIDDRLLVYHAGQFSETMPNHGIAQIALLRLDGDLYESTKTSLEHLYPVVARGGWVICDDFKLSGARKALLEYAMPGPIYWRKDN